MTWKWIQFLNKSGQIFVSFKTANDIEYEWRNLWKRFSEKGSGTSKPGRWRIPVVDLSNLCQVSLFFWDLVVEPKHPLLKGDYTGHEKTYFGDLDISPRLAETKRKQKISEKSGLPIFLGSSWFPSGKNDLKLAVRGSRPHNLSPSGAVNFSNALLYWMFRD